MKKAGPLRVPSRSLDSAVESSVHLLLSHQNPEEGYWYYTLEANESIGAGFIQLMHFLSDVDPVLERGLSSRILSKQRDDGSWAIFHDGPGDLSTTIECYFALRLAGHLPSEEFLQRARKFILEKGGLTQARVFTRIHLALFGLVPWSSCPAMPVWFVFLPHWLGISIYEFSSWARASIVPLLLICEAKPVHKISFDLEELYPEAIGDRYFRLPPSRFFFSLQNFFIQFDKLLKWVDKLPCHPGKKLAVKKAERWVREHIERTEDIYPAMAYAAIALKSMGYPPSDPTIRKAVNGLKGFQQKYLGQNLPESSPPSPLLHDAGEGSRRRGEEMVHQQCCISPNWDTPWAGLALIEAGVDPQDPRLLKAARYLISKEIKDFSGDWWFKNRKGPPGGWSFEFQNDYFPDVDDTIEAIHFLKRVGLPENEKAGPIQRGVAWMLSMQSKNGGWAAFDKNNSAGWVNKIPFSDHGACLDPPTPDITGRMLELLSLFGFKRTDPVVKEALTFLEKTQEADGSWRGRWGVNYIYGTWCVLQGLVAIGEELNSPPLRKGVEWLRAIQNKNGGWGESCLSDRENKYIPLDLSLPSQTAWATMGLIAAGERDSLAGRLGIEWLVQNQNDEGGWNESHFTGTGFPGHFYIRYHGYRYYFPLLALARYSKIRFS